MLIMVTFLPSYSLGYMLEIVFLKIISKVLQAMQFKTKQNELISICGDLIRREILQRIHIADEATDVVNDEQLSISIRFVDGDLPSE